MSSINWIGTVLVFIALTNSANCTRTFILNQVSPPPPRDVPKSPLSAEEQARINAEIDALYASGQSENDNGPYAWELSGLFEGDIMLDPDQHSRNGLRNESYRWPNGIIPFYINELDFTNKEKGTILEAMKEYHRRTNCIMFKPYDLGDGSYVHIRSTDCGCYSSVGRLGQIDQILNLHSPGCVTHGVILHELLHAIGFHHQQSASNRDNYVRILWNNIKKGKKHNFKKYGDSAVTSFGVEYDYGSIMHYSAKHFSKNGKPTIVPLKPNVMIGHIKSLSSKDITKLERMYRNSCVHRKKSDYARFDELLNAVHAALKNSTS